MKQSELELQFAVCIQINTNLLYCINNILSEQNRSRKSAATCMVHGIKTPVLLHVSFPCIAPDGIQLPEYVVTVYSELDNELFFHIDLGSKLLWNSIFDDAVSNEILQELCLSGRAYETIR